MLSLKHNSLSQPLNSDLRLIVYLWISCLQGVVGIVVKFFFLYQSSRHSHMDLRLVPVWGVAVKT